MDAAEAVRRLDELNAGLKAASTPTEAATLLEEAEALSPYGAFAGPQLLAYGMTNLANVRQTA